MAKAGIFDGKESIELLDGHVVEMNPEGAPHRVATIKVSQAFIVVLGEAPYTVQTRSTLPLDALNVPESDLAVLRGAPVVFFKFWCENLFGGLSTACDFVDLVQNGFCIRPVVPLQGVIWAPFCNFAHCVSESYPSTKQVLTLFLTLGTGSSLAICVAL